MSTKYKAADDYRYDANGNLTRDQNKNIDNIIYNHLALPVEIDFHGGDKITYLYNALGQKLKKSAPSGDVMQLGDTETLYLDGFQYVQNSLKFFPHAEGYVNVVDKSGNHIFNYVFNYTDHLGNIRMNWAQDPETGQLKILEENHYYPFGLKHDNYNMNRKDFELENEQELKLKAVPQTQQEVYKYKYQGQERQDELGLNWDSFKFRNYDYTIGRFMNVDPLAEKFPYNGVYNFCENRVIDARELEGLEAFFIHGTESSPNRWTEKAVNTIMQLTNNKTSNTGFSWENLSGITNNSQDRNAAAKKLVEYIKANRVEGEGVTLIGHSHGGNVAIQAAKMYYMETGERVNVIGIATPAYNTEDGKKPLMEDPNTKLGLKAIENFLSLFNTIDCVQGGLAGSKHFNLLGGDDTFSRNAGVIDVSGFYSWYEFLDAHSFDVEHPSTIQDAINNGYIKGPIEHPGSAGSADDLKNQSNTLKKIIY